MLFCFVTKSSYKFPGIHRYHEQAITLDQKEKLILIMFWLARLSFVIMKVNQISFQINKFHSIIFNMILIYRY